MNTLLASVELGSPAADCNHYGICSVELLPPEHWETLTPAHFRHIKALLSLGTGGGLFFQIPLSGIRADTFLAFFPPEGFRVDSAKVLPDEITASLGLPNGAGTVPGLYRWQMADGMLRLALPVTVVEQQVLRAA
jgi:hypothetical protein